MAVNQADQAESTMSQTGTSCYSSCTRLRWNPPGQVGPIDGRYSACGRPALRNSVC
jgi:hypothetical protein